MSKGLCEGFLVCVLAVAALFASAGAVAAAESDRSGGDFRVSHAWDKQNIAIQIEGLRKPLRVLHLTDTHVSGLHPNAVPGPEPKKNPTDVNVLETLKKSKEMNLDLIVLTGDIIHFPKREWAEYVAKALDATGVPWLYIAGNHDVDTKDGADPWPALEPLTKGRNAFNSLELGGILFVGIDDSQYSVTAEQLAFFRRELKKGRPTVLLMHIPLSVPTLRPKSILWWGCPILLADPDWPGDRKWLSLETLPSRFSDKTTTEFAWAAAAAPNLVAVLSGHLHGPSADNVNPKSVQYVGPHCGFGDYRLVEFLPFVPGSNSSKKPANKKN